MDVDEGVERVVDHLLHVSYDERTVLRLTSTGDDEESITAVGKALFGAKPGESLRLRGSWAQHPRDGRQFRAEKCERTVPADERAIRLYRASGMIRGIGPALAAAIVDTFRERTLKITDTEPERLLEVHNIGEIRLGQGTCRAGRILHLRGMRKALSLPVGKPPGSTSTACASSTPGWPLSSRSDEVR
ncbi:hypothetical protein [Streptomyces sp. NPDC058297]|uniref:YrrC family ATP-dependent DNA helicase n=1 Tax=Streptomyces sp. NPDC058297 TaxID=3346433 RepID=UPI0036EF3233